MPISGAVAIVVNLVIWLVTLPLNILTVCLNLLSTFMGRISFPLVLLLILLVSGLVWADYHNDGFIKTLFHGDLTIMSAYTTTWNEETTDDLITKIGVATLTRDFSGEAYPAPTHEARRFSYVEWYDPQTPYGIIWTKVNRPEGHDVTFWVLDITNTLVLGLTETLTGETYSIDSAYTDWQPIYSIDHVLEDDSFAGKTAYFDMIDEMAGNGTLCLDSQYLNTLTYRDKPTIYFIRDSENTLKSNCSVLYYTDTKQRFPCSAMLSIYGIGRGCADVLDNTTFFLNEQPLVVETGGVLSVFRTIDSVAVNIIRYIDTYILWIIETPTNESEHLLLGIYIMLRDLFVLITAGFIILLALSIVWGVSRYA